HYSSVRMQQGRVQLDSDWNEQVDIQTRRQQLEAQDLVGQSGAPLDGGGFQVTVSSDGQSQSLMISRGHMYVDGLLCELDADTDYTKQRDYPGATLPAAGVPGVNVDKANGCWVFLAYLDAWERHVTAIDDPHLREVALGGPDTGTRVQIVPQ